jgi:hypothetical protein
MRTGEPMGSWHVPGDQLARYAGRELTPPLLWSIDAHLMACAQCRAALAAAPAAPQDRWERLDAALDAPVPGPAERLLVRLGVPEYMARLLAATPALRTSWLAAVTLTLAFTAVVARAAEPVVFLAVAPMLPVAGVALSFGPLADPTYELSLVAPMHTFKLLLLRCVAVLAATTGLSAAASLALPSLGLAAVGWFLPALALTLASLALTPRLGPVLAAGSVAACWLAAVVFTLGSGAGGSAVFTPAGQAALAALGGLAGLLVIRLRSRFDIGNDDHRGWRLGGWRIS